MNRPNKNWVLYRDAPVEVHDFLEDKRGCGNCDCTVENLYLSDWLLIEKHVDWWIIVNTSGQHRSYHIYARAFRIKEEDFRGSTVKTEQFLVWPEKPPVPPGDLPKFRTAKILPPWFKVVRKHTEINVAGRRLIARVKRAADQVSRDHKKPFNDYEDDYCCCCGQYGG